MALMTFYLNNFLGTFRSKCNVGENIIITDAERHYTLHDLKLSRDDTHTSLMNIPIENL